MNNYEFNDDIDITRNYSFGDKIDVDNIRNSFDNLPLFSYAHIDLTITDYGFRQSCFDNKDIRKYFETVKEFSTKTINDLINSDYKNHFHFYPTPKGKILWLLKQISGKKYFRESELPSIGQFALYTEGNADRERGIKSPRIFFMLGANAIFYILFYDPYHEIRK